MSVNELNGFWAVSGQKLHVDTFQIQRVLVLRALLMLLYTDDDGHVKVTLRLGIAARGGT